MASRRAKSRRQGARQPQPAAPAPATTQPDASTDPSARAARQAGAPRHPKMAGWPEIPDQWFFGLAAAVLLVGAALRLYDLPLVPFHHDEGINGYAFVKTLAEQGTWKYDPANYHGPTLFYFGLLSDILFGLNDTAMRLVPAVFGLGTIALVLAMRPFIGSVAALTGAGLLALSPAATYYSRYFIHETLLVFFTLGLIVSILYYLRDGRERFLLLAGVSLALMLATKETAFPTLLVLLVAIVVGTAYVEFRAPRRGRSPLRTSLLELRERLFTPERLITAGLVGLIVYIAFFTSFLANPEGALDSLEALAVWTETGGETQIQPPTQYLQWMLRGDPVILGFGVVGGLIVAARGYDRLAVFIGLWALGITVGYSLITYKVPWIAVNMLTPLAIVGGIGVRELLQVVRSRRLWAMGAAAAAGGLAFATYQTVDLNFNRYDDEFASPYVFVHTTREATALVNETIRIGNAAGTGDQTGFVFMAPEYWPLPWYYRDYPRAGFFGAIIDTTEAVVVTSTTQEADVVARLGDRYVRKGEYTLRPGVELVLYVRSDLASL